jgi:hypothetical protein
MKYTNLTLIEINLSLLGTMSPEKGTCHGSTSQHVTESSNFVV